MVASEAFEIFLDSLGLYFDSAHIFIFSMKWNVDLKQPLTKLRTLI